MDNPTTNAPVTHEQFNAHYTNVQPEKRDWLWTQYVEMAKHQQAPMTIDSFEFAMGLLFNLNGEAQS